MQAWSLRLPSTGSKSLFCLSAVFQASVLMEMVPLTHGFFNMIHSNLTDGKTSFMITYILNFSPSLVTLYRRHMPLVILKSWASRLGVNKTNIIYNSCLLYTSDAADDLLCVDLGGRRI